MVLFSMHCMKTSGKWKFKSRWREAKNFVQERKMPPERKKFSLRLLGKFCLCKTKWNFNYELFDIKCYCRRFFSFCSALKTDVKARNLCNTFLISFFEEMKGNHGKEKSEISPNLKTSSIMCFRIKSDCVSGRKMCSLLMGWEHGKAKTKGKEKYLNGKCT